MAFERAAARLVEDITDDYATKAGRVWTGAVELSLEECRAALFEIVADAELVAQAEHLYAVDHERISWIRSCILPARLTA